MITEHALRKYIAQARPLGIHLCDGRDLEVSHRDRISIQPGGTRFLLWLNDGGFEIFKLSMVTSVRFAPL